MDTRDFPPDGGLERKRGIREELLKLLLSSPDGVLLNDLINSFSAIDPDNRSRVSYRLGELEEQGIINVSPNHTKLRFANDPFDFEVRASLTTKGLREGRELLHALNPALQQAQSANGDINVQLGDNAHVQFQHSSPGASQNIQHSDADNQKLKTALQEIKEKLDELSSQLSSEDFAALKGEVTYLDGTLSRPNPDPFMLRALWKNIVGILKSVPENIAANLITEGVF